MTEQNIDTFRPDDDHFYSISLIFGFIPVWFM
jgi:hypothetical protein